MDAEQLRLIIQNMRIEQHTREVFNNQLTEQVKALQKRLTAKDASAKKDKRPDDETLRELTKTMHEDANKALNSKPEYVLVPDEEQQKTCCWTKTDLTQGSGEEIYVVEYIYVGHKPIDKPVKKVILCNAALQKMQAPKYDYLITNIYDDWDTFIKKTGGINISEAQGPWYPTDKSPDMYDADAIPPMNTLVKQAFENDAPIHFKMTNPKKLGSKSYERYEIYKTATTLKEMLSLGGKYADMKYDYEHEYFSFE